MKLGVFEFVCGGGYDVQPLSSIPASLQSEGRAMLCALVEDFRRTQELEVIAPVDARQTSRFPRELGYVKVQAEVDFLEAWISMARQCDASVVIAPELGGQLIRCVDGLRQSGAAVLASSSEFLNATCDKWQTAQFLMSSGLDHPPTQILSLEYLDDQLSQLMKSTELAIDGYCVKPRDGAGCEGIIKFDQTSAVESLKYCVPAERYLVQPWIRGQSGSIVVLCGPKQRVVLPAMKQHLSTGARPTYLGSSGPWNEPIKEELEQFAFDILDQLPGQAQGWIGIDFVIPESSPCRPMVIEVNPRVTTSLLGLRQILGPQLVLGMIQIAMGNPWELPPHGSLNRLHQVSFSV